MIPMLSLRSAIAAGTLFLAAGLTAALAAPEQDVSTRYEIRFEDLPKLGATPSSVNPPKRVARQPEDGLRVPQGFKADIFAEGLRHPRWMGLAPNGDVFLAEAGAGKITLLRDRDGDGKAETVTTYAKGFKRPHGIAFVEGAVLIADTEGIWSLEYGPGDTLAKKRRLLTRRGAFGGAPQNHWTRNIAVAPDRSALYVAIGSKSNISEEPRPHATVQKFDMDGGNQTTFAAGLRNPVGIAFYPGTDDLYVVVNERDGYGDAQVPDYLTRIEKGAFYGWPYAWLGPNPDPEMKGKRPDLVKKTKRPDLLFEAHSAPIGLVFYDETQFPESYRGDAFVALRGSWNSGEPTGYKIVRVKFENGRPAGWYDNFTVGFWKAGEDRAQVWGRPAGLLIAADGSLLIADDTGGTVWRVSYEGG